MQTFLPYSDFRRSATCLDNKRLGKQRVEAYQILRTLVGVSKGWRNHPAVKMWAGYEHALVCYLFEICAEWTDRGFRDSIREKCLDLGFCDSLAFNAPRWLGDERLHASHRSNLLRKNAEHYGQFRWAEGPELSYFWPSKEGY